DVDASFLALLRGTWRRSLGQWIETATGLREGDDVADGLRVGQQLQHAVPTQGDAAMRWGPVLEAFKQEAELGVSLLLSHAHELEDALLDVALVDTDRTAADFVAVAHDVVCVGKCRSRIGVEGVHELWLRAGERMVHSGPSASAHGHIARGNSVRRGFEHWCVDDPDESPVAFLDQT